jgi:hypothetical protein
LEGTKQPLFNRLKYILVKCSFYVATFPLKVLEFKFIFSKNLQNNKTHDLEFPNSIPIGHLGNLCHFDVVYVVIDKIFQWQCFIVQLVYVGWDFGDRHYDNSKTILDYNSW